MVKKRGSNHYRNQIWKWFFLKTLPYKPERELLKDWLEFLFHYKYRSISNYVSVAKFRMPGESWITPNVRSRTGGARNINSETILTVRKDMRENYIDIEMSNPERIFRLDFSEWKSILPYIERINKT